MIVCFAFLPMGVDDAIKLYWPSHLCSPKTQQGFLLGWVNKANSICIASVVSDIQLDELQELLCQFCDSSGHSEFIHINKVCAVPPQIVGVLVKQNELSAFSNQDDDQHDWLKVTLNEAYIPVLSSLTLNSTHIQFNTFEVIFYEQPNPKRLQFLALEPLELDISSKDIPPKIDIDRKYMEAINHYKGIIDFGHKLHGETEPVSDELGSILIQVK
ncbi:MAG: hypothetical protein EXX96DRAFT_381641 [Benjaminiella poitrasii]|nr:MAG: hypothetical protein EXX96DRAFT_381641 [Benjaminiella poitrasii]